MRSRKPVWPFTLNRASPLARGLGGWWPGGIAGGTRIHDMSGKNNHGTLHTFGSTSTSGWSLGNDGGSSLVCDGSDDYVGVGNIASHDVTTNDYAFGAWANWTGTGAVGMLMCRTTGFGTAGYEILLGEGSSTGRVTYRSNSGSGIVLSAPTDVWNNGRWHLVVVSRINGVAYLYIDGIARNSSADSANITNASASLNFFGRANSSFFFGGGRASDFMLYPTRGLTAAEVWALYDPKTRWSLRYQLNTVAWSIPTGGGGGLSIPIAMRHYLRMMGVG